MMLWLSRSMLFSIASARQFGGSAAVFSMKAASSLNPGDLAH
jgi:hypothetical protein